VGCTAPGGDYCRARGGALAKSYQLIWASAPNDDGNRSVTRVDTKIDSCNTAGLLCRVFLDVFVHGDGACAAVDKMFD